VTRDAGRPIVSDALLEEPLEDLYEHAPSGYLSTLPDGRIVKVNTTLVDWLGTSRDDLLAGATFQSLLTVGSKIYHETHYAPLLRMQGAVDEIALELRRADGRVLPVLVNARQRRDDAGTPLVNRITVFNATDRRRYERELLLARRAAEQMAKDKAELLAMLSHDIRNPLSAVMNAVLLLERSALDEPQRRYVRALKTSSENMLHLLNHVLEFSKAESSGVVLRETPFSFHSVVRDVLSTFEAAAREKALPLTAAIDDRLPATVIGDPIAIRQILTNLVGNAVKFTPAGSVDVRVAAPDVGTDAVTVAVSVIDTGIGIAPEMIEQVFNEFTQGSGDTASRFGGTGLGLTITRRLLALYGSRVQVRSVVGEGSTFSFSLRLALPVEKANVKT
jgi:PAS domain S-box-containing protein